MAIRDELEFEKASRPPSFEDGIAGLGRIFAETPDLVILDLMLPGKSGFEICREVARPRIGYPIIMLTARAGGGTGSGAWKLGADDYVIKAVQSG